MSFRAKILLFVTLGCLFCTAAAVLIAKSRFHTDLEKSLTEKSEAILTRLESARKYVANQGLLEKTIKETVREYPSGNLPDEVKQTILNVVPIYASLKIGSEDAKKDNYVFRVAAKEARRKENEADAKEIEYLDRFEADNNLKQLTYDNVEDNTLWVMRPIRISSNDGCLNCHGHPSTSPYKNGKDVLGFPMENWKDGHLHGMFVIKSSKNALDAQVSAASVNMFIWAGGILAIALIVCILLLRKPINALTSITQRLKNSASQGLESSRTLGQAAQSVSSATSEQAAGVQETMASMSEMNSMITRTLDLAKQTQDLSSELDIKSNNGTKVMQGMVTSMESIKQSNEELKKMVQIINDISTKTNVINEIVFKTQLLSVNASIEAARAGQHGKGFAVVAEEVGNLAQVSGKAAEEIRDMLTKSQAHVQEVVNVTNTRVAEGERVSHEAMKSFVDISEGIRKIQSYSQSVSEATNQQQEGITQINTAMTQMDQASQQNSEMAIEVNSLSNEMVSQSEDLADIGKETDFIIFGQEHNDMNSKNKKSNSFSKSKDKSEIKSKISNTDKKISADGLKAKIKTSLQKIQNKPLANGADHDDKDFEKIA